MLALKPDYFEQIKKIEKQKAITAMNLGQFTQYMTRYEHELNKFPSVKAVFMNEKNRLENKVHQAEEEIQKIYEKVRQNRFNSQGYVSINAQV